MKPDTQQEKAIKCIHNNSLIIAGAGSGKTTTLLFKIDELLNNNVKENEILVISFTNETVNNFKKKLKHKIDVMTFHKLALKIVGNTKEIIEDDILEDVISNYLQRIPTKLKKKIFFILYVDVFSQKKYHQKTITNGKISITGYLARLVNIIKANNIDINQIDINKFSLNETIIIYCVRQIYTKYEKILKENNFMDFDDLIIDATKHILYKKYTSPYKYILVDEYQDISQIRLDFLKALIDNNNAILTAVGDDFQSIYGFNGSNNNLFYKFQNYYKNSKIFYITTTYRCPQRIISKAGKFIMKNPYQIKKKLNSINKCNSKIKKIYTSDQKKALVRIINIYINKEETILILGRNNFDINFMIDKKRNFEDSYLVYNQRKYNKIRYLTIHKSKGLEADIVIIINLSNGKNGFPNEENDKLVRKICKNDEDYMLAEERRLFYVALTRCRKKIYLIIDKKNPSIFVKEI